MSRVVVIRFQEVGEAARANRHWTDRECDAVLLQNLHAMNRVESRWRTVLQGLAVVVLVGVGIVLGMVW